MKRTQMSRRPSKAKRDFDAEYAAVLPGILSHGCQFERYSQGHFPHAGCSGRLVGHHLKGRRVANANDYVLCLCDYHHTIVHQNPRWSREVGLMLSRVAP
jgi:hypothetical protein